MAGPGWKIRKLLLRDCNWEELDCKLQYRNLRPHFTDSSLQSLCSLPEQELNGTRPMFCETVQILVEFLEVAITSIIYLKGIYPSGAFERRRYMNAVVQRASHPELQDYIHSTVSGLLPFIQKGLVERVAVIFFNGENIQVERFVFKLMVNQSYESKVENSDLEFALRSFLIKLSVSEPLTKALPPDCKWEITAFFKTLPSSGTSKDAELWIPTDTKLWQQPPVITPIKSMNSQPLSLQLYLEHPSLSEPKPCE